ncbi:hypothetical protein [Lyngbya sp. CCY1209]|uniref:hypothetical protein n=1 Tax=Lyngbya sp. CCY1209 TaxID=2886103 RepID=UPI002D20551A|nr:hypothetical protein [Lyngbya sp. CCY1209]MEB3885437.1 hypothetical protein [Lyngbya sp. CCY1209]
MFQPANSQKRFFSLLFGAFAGLTLAAWILRGLTLLAFLPGSVIWLLLILAIATGVLSRVAR